MVLNVFCGRVLKPLIRVFISVRFSYKFLDGEKSACQLCNNYKVPCITNSLTLFTRSLLEDSIREAGAVSLNMASASIALVM